MKFLILVVDDEPDVELLFRQQFRHDLRDGRFAMEFAQSAQGALQRITECDTDSKLWVTGCPEDGVPATDGLPSIAEGRRPAPATGSKTPISDQPGR